MKGNVDSASFLLDNKVLLIDDLLSNEYSLFLYDKDVDVWRSFQSFINNGLANDELCLCAYDHTSTKLQLDKVFEEPVGNGKLRLFPLGKGYLPKEIEDLGEGLQKICKEARSDAHVLRVLVDFGGLVSHHSFGHAIDFLREIISKKKETFYSRADKKKRFLIRTSIVAFSLESLDENEIRALISLYKNVVISSKNGTTTLALDFRSRRVMAEPEVALAPKDALEHFVKRHFETIVLSILSEHPMCGYDVIKTIYQRYHASLSQGTVYSLLYLLESKGLLTVDVSDSRSKVYVLTEQGRKRAESQIKDFVVAQRYLLESIQKT